MKYIQIDKILSEGQPGDSVCAAGWIKSLRQSKNVTFMHINDGSCLASLQVILDESLDNYELIASQITGASVLVKGTLQESPAKGQTVELLPSSVDVIGPCDSSSPVQKAGTSFEFLREIAHMRPRTNSLGAVFRVRSKLSYLIHSFFNERGFVYAHTPIVTTSDCEGAGEMFQVTTLDPAAPPTKEDGSIDYQKDFFGEKASLTVSGQLEAEILACSMSKVYTFGPTFRAENSNTARHASEFWMIEPEIAFADLNDDIALAEEFVKYIIDGLMTESSADLEFFDQRIEKGLKEKLRSVVESDFEIMEYSEAVDLLAKSGQSFEYEPEWGKALQTQHERYICEKITKRPTFVINYPKIIKPFYMYCNDDDKTVACFDMLVPRVGELIGGSQREHRIDLLLERMREHDMDVDSYKWYLDLRRFGTVPHAGFGLGFERTLMYVTGMENIRDVVLCPRVPGNAKF